MSCGSQALFEPARSQFAALPIEQGLHSFRCDLERLSSMGPRLLPGELASLTGQIHHLSHPDALLRDPSRDREIGIREKRVRPHERLVCLEASRDCIGPHPRISSDGRLFAEKLGERQETLGSAVLGPVSVELPDLPHDYQRGDTGGRDWDHCAGEDSPRGTQQLAANEGCDLVHPRTVSGMSR